MSVHIIELDGPAAFWRFISERSIHLSNWRSLRVWLHPDGGKHHVELPPTAEARLFEAYGQLRPLAAAGSTQGLNLGDLWRRARPVPRLGSSVPAKHLLISASHYEELAQLAIAEAPYGLESIGVEYRTPDGRSTRIERGLLVHGEAGRLLAHARPYGCTSLECDEPRGGVLAALPIGWCPPGLPEELWPDGREIVLRYSIDAGEHQVEQGKLMDRRSLVALLRSEPKPLEALPDPKRDIGQTPWRVIRSNRASTPDDDESVSVVYRIRTFAPSPHDGSSYGVRAVHELGEIFLRVLDECEAGHLPDIRYAALDRRGRERWHFLIVKDADPALREAWIGLERFDLLRDLQPRGINAYLSIDARMIPPMQAMLGGQGDEETLKRIKQLLGSPSETDLVLIEDMPDPDDGAERMPLTKPLLIHIDTGKTRSLHEILPGLIRDWHNAEPLHALDDWTKPEGVEELRNSLERTLASIGEDEDEELRAAARKAIEALDECARRASEAIRVAMAPVAEASETSDRLAESLLAAEAGIAETCRSLATICRALTEPRRAWIAARTLELRDALAASAPVEGEVDAARSTADSVVGDLAARIRQLTLARDAIAPLAPRLQSQAREAGQAREAAEVMREQVEQAANAALAAIRENFARAEDAQARATARATEVTRERERLTALERQVSEQERENQRLDRLNQERSAALEQRRLQAEAERREIEDRRDREIPEQERQIRRLEQELQAMRPEEVRRRHDELGAQIQALEGRLVRLREMKAEIARRDAVARSMEEEAARVERENQAARETLARRESEARRRLEEANASRPVGPGPEVPPSPGEGPTPRGADPEPAAGPTQVGGGLLNWLKSRWRKP